MLGDYLKFNSETFPNPITPTKTSKTLENVATSEAGTDLVCIVRPSKLSWSFKFNLSSNKRDKLEALTHDESTQMSYMGSTYKVRVRDFQERLVQGSEYVSTSEGLYECSVKVTEF